MKRSRVIVFLLVLMVAGFWLGKRNLQEKPVASESSSLTGAMGEDPDSSDPSAAKASKRPRAEPESSEIEFVRSKLKSMVVPVIAFDDVSVQEAFDFLRKRSIDLDPAPDPDRRKVSVLLRLPDSGDKDGQAPPGDAPKIRRLVDVEARDISLWDALHLIAREANLKVVITDQCVELRPR